MNRFGTLSTALACAIATSLGTAEAARQTYNFPPVPHYDLTLQSNIPNIEQGATHDDRHPDLGDRSIEHIPFIVQVIPSERSPEDKKRDEEKTTIDQQMAAFTRDLATYTNLLFWATAGLAAFTLGLALVAFFQMRDARRSIRAAEASAAAAVKQITVAEDTAQRQLRAYVFADRSSMTLVNDKGDILSFTAEKDPNFNIPAVFVQVLTVFKNYGLTPAHEFRYFRDVDVANLQKSDDPDAVRDYEDTKDTIGPGMEYPITTRRCITKEEFTEVKNRVKEIFSMGQIHYTDIFGKRQSASFCHVNGAMKDGGWVIEPRFTWGRPGVRRSLRE
jgi:hypothetical protein